MEFRITELEGRRYRRPARDADPGRRRRAPAPVAVAPPVAGADAPELAVGEQADFDRAKEVLGTGDFRTAADLFATFTETYPGGPLSAEALYLRGEALSQLGETAEAARSYLEAFSGTPNGPRARRCAAEAGAEPGQAGPDARGLRDADRGGRAVSRDRPRRREAVTAMQGLGCS